MKLSTLDKVVNVLILINNIKAIFVVVFGSLNWPAEDIEKFEKNSEIQILENEISKFDNERLERWNLR